MHEAESRIRYVALPALAAQLPRDLGEMKDAAVCTREHAPVSVRRNAPARSDLTSFYHPSPFPFLAEPEILEVDEEGDRETVIYPGDVDVARRNTRHSEGTLRCVTKREACQIGRLTDVLMRVRFTYAQQIDGPLHLPSTISGR